MKSITGNVLVLLAVVLCTVFLSVVTTLLVLEHNETIEIVDGDVQPIEYVGHPFELSWDTTISGGASAIINPGEPDEEIFLWRDCQVWELNNQSADILSLKSFDSDVATLIYTTFTDEEWQGHLLRHGATQEEIDFVIAKFKDESLIRD